MAKKTTTPPAEAAPLTVEILHAEMAAAIGRAARRAWRELHPRWRDAEAEVGLAAAVALVQRHRPDLDEPGIAAELHRLGVVEPGSEGRMSVRVPALPDPLPPASERAN